MFIWKRSLETLTYKADNIINIILVIVNVIFIVIIIVTIIDNRVMFGYKAVWQKFQCR